MKLKDNKIVKGAMSGLKPATIGLIAAAVISIGKSVFFSNGFYISLLKDYSFLCSLFIFVLILLLVINKVNPILLIMLSAILGILSGYIKPLII